MLKYCASYASVYWKNVGAPMPYDQVPEYGIRVDFDIPVTTRCLQCQDPLKGGGTCGFDTQNQSFICLCKDGNSTTHCKGTSKFNKLIIGLLWKRNYYIVFRTITSIRTNLYVIGS